MSGVNNRHILSWLMVKSIVSQDCSASLVNTFVLCWFVGTTNRSHSSLSNKSTFASTNMHEATGRQSSSHYLASSPSSAHSTGTFSGTNPRSHDPLATRRHVSPFDEVDQSLGGLETAYRDFRDRTSATTTELMSFPFWFSAARIGGAPVE